MIRIAFGGNSSGSSVCSDLEMGDGIMISSDYNTTRGDPVLGTWCGHTPVLSSHTCEIRYCFPFCIDEDPEIQQDPDICPRVKLRMSRRVKIKFGSI